MLDGTEFFECECGSDEHTLRFVLSLDEGSTPRIPELYTSTFLSERVWYQRIWPGIKYIFGYKCRYGHWDVFSLQEEDAERLINLTQRFKTAREQSRGESDVHGPPENGDN